MSPDMPAPTMAIEVFLALETNAALLFLDLMYATPSNHAPLASATSARLSRFWMDGAIVTGADRPTRADPEKAWRQCA